MNSRDGFLPDEVVIQVLARLPVKYLFRAKTVCKLWYKLSSDKYFVQLYNEVAAKNSVVLVEVSHSSELKSSLICADNSWGVSELSLDFLKDRVKVRASCNGLLCCSSIPDKGVYYVCNPMTREFRLLPRSRERPVTRFCPDGEATLVGLGCNLSVQKFNVVLAGYHRTFGHRKISLPDEVIYSAGNRAHLLELDGCLSVIQISEEWMKIWAMKDYESEEWHLEDRHMLSGPQSSRVIKNVADMGIPASRTVSLRVVREMPFAHVYEV
ncbi:F-BOX PROTEIN INTERACTION DOMAIN PROTEIN [Salix viminalis]|uniref:F-BOX PROTEIN INTERACTION DOMAIN PROTEIN n=1 Tax=Salix viminalis TaxID=40686 RepID=A0A9Q0U000_SALVM|nr:F-BOX PROTEIN INTERACTION DOMAIN PROTEIN [Salix viminalis]